MFYNFAPANETLAFLGTLAIAFVMFVTAVVAFLGALGILGIIRLLVLAASGAARAAARPLAALRREDGRRDAVIQAFPLQADSLGPSTGPFTGSITVQRAG